MNETERERIMRMLADGTLRPEEAAKLLSVMAELDDKSAAAAIAAKEAAAKEQQQKEKAKEIEQSKVKPQVMDVKRADGSHYAVEVPPGLLPAIVKVTGAYIKESAKVAGQEAWGGLKTMVRNKAEEVKTTVKNRGPKPVPKPDEPVGPSPEDTQKLEARRRILQMVQNGRLSAADASRLIQQLDAHEAYLKTHSGAQPTA